MAAQWEFWIDRGGTFTDIVAQKPDGTYLTHKLLSENPKHYADAAVAGIRHALNLSTDAAIPESAIASVKMGTTVATNALLERQGEPTLLLMTQGLTDVLRIGYQTRPDLFALDIRLPKPLYACCVAVEERMAANGDQLTPLNQQAALTTLHDAYAQGYRSVAIVLMHAFQYPQHEITLAAMAKTVGFTHVSASHQVSPLIKLVNRGHTTVIDAYLSPVLKRYVKRVQTALGQIPLLFMQSNGGLTDAPHFHGKNAILSGPAGGVVGMVKTAELEGFKQLIGFDMGGTSTDVSHYAGTYERTFDTDIAGVHVSTPMMHIHTVAAGGGSILAYQQGRFQVGPASAGAYPGPTCYRHDGPLTITDCHVLLGRIQPDHFPAIFGPQHNQALDRDRVVDKFQTLAAQINAHTSTPKSVEDIALGFLDIAIDNMANAIKHISSQRGYDVSTYVLCAFGGAGGQHACRVADALGMQSIFLHRHAAVLSAYGIGLAERRTILEQTLSTPLHKKTFTTIQQHLTQLSAKATTQMVAQGVTAQAITIKCKAQLRYTGVDSVILVDWTNLDGMAANFTAQHQQYFGFTSPKQIVVEAIHVDVSSGAKTVHLKEPNNTHQATPDSRITLYDADQWQSVPLRHWAGLKPKQRILGPASIIDANNTVLIETGWQAKVTTHGNLVLERVHPLLRAALSTAVDPILLEIINNAYRTIAEQMGAVLEKTATSVNIKERLDFSCAIFDEHGELIVNAPHIPVHLGSMSDSIQAVIAQFQNDMHEGDVFILNSPYQGGTHLPDITLVKPIWQAQHIAFYVASRGHHADIGGITPGSMPPHSRHIQEEGILIPAQKLITRGTFQESRLITLLTQGQYPARNPKQNIEDLLAQVAACEKGRQGLEHLVCHFGLSVVKAYMQHVQDHAEQSVKQLLTHLQDGAFTYPMDDGSRIQVALRVDQQQQQATIDFAGTSAQHSGNFNAPKSVCKAAVLYVFRCLVGTDIPLNAGFFKPLKILIPAHSMLAPEAPAAVVAGNVETSQAIVDALFGATQTLAASQGTCNNLTFGNDQFQYYETLCGGSGAGPGFHGTDAVHTHMTNSRLTDPEILEQRFPVLLKTFCVRHNTGGLGQYVGGQGVVRELVFQQKMTVAILSNHRRIAPFGLAGGNAGAIGENTLIRANGQRTRLSGCEQIMVDPGDSLQIKTPGGGGFGKID